MMLSLRVQTPSLARAVVMVVPLAFCRVPCVRDVRCATTRASAAVLHVCYAQACFGIGLCAATAVGTKSCAGIDDPPQEHCVVLTPCPCVCGACTVAPHHACLPVHGSFTAIAPMANGTKYGIARAAAQ